MCKHGNPLESYLVSVAYAPISTGLEILLQGIKSLLLMTILGDFLTISGRSDHKRENRAVK